MLGGKVKPRLRGRIAQERPALRATAQGLGEVRDITPWGHELAALKAPMGREMVDHPSVALHRRELLHHVGQMRSPLVTGTSWAEMPHELPRGDHTRGQQRAHAMADVFVFPLFWFPRLYRLGGVGTWEHRPPRFFVGTDDAAPWVEATERLRRELTDIVRLGVAVGIVAVEPVHAPMRCEVGLLQEAPEAGATHGLRPQALPEGDDQLSQTPPGRGTMVRGGFLGGHRQHIDPISGGKSAAGDLRAAHRAGREGRAAERADANGRRDGAHRPARWPPAPERGDRARRSAGCADSARPRLGA
jgi:hypothetical protein